MARVTKKTITTKEAKPSIRKVKTAAVIKKAEKPAGKVTVKKVTTRLAQGLEIDVVDVTGKSQSKITLPKELFAAKVNKQLLAQAVRVYLANQREGSAATKTRGMVTGSTKKIYRQKGTGRARHGGITAPIFVGGGVAFGPQPRSFALDLPKNMRRVALASALTQQLQHGNIIVIDGLDTMEPKTRLFAETFKHIGATRRVLFIVPKDPGTVVRAARNLEHVDILPVTQLHTYAILAHQKLVFMKTALADMTQSGIEN